MNYIYWKEEQPGPKLQINMIYTKEADFYHNTKWQDKVPEVTSVTLSVNLF